MRFAEGDLFSAAKLKESKRRLRNTTYFKESDLKLVKTDDPDRVNIDTVVEERPTGTISMGIGYSTYENVILTGSISQDNLFGTGLKAYLTAAVSSINQLYDISLVQPYIFDLDLYSSPESLQHDAGISTLMNTGARAVPYRLIRPITDNTRVGLKYGYLTTDVFNIHTGAGDYIRSQAGTTSTSSVTASIAYNTINDLLNPTKGVIADTSLELAGGALRWGQRVRQEYRPLWKIFSVVVGHHIFRAGDGWLRLALRQHQRRAYLPEFLRWEYQHRSRFQIRHGRASGHNQHADWWARRALF